MPGQQLITGVPEKHRFDLFYGHYDQVHAHDVLTDHLIRDSKCEPIRRSGKKTWDDCVATHITNETLSFIGEGKVEGIT